MRMACDAWLQEWLEVIKTRMKFSLKRNEIFNLRYCPNPDHQEIGSPAYVIDVTPSHCARSAHSVMFLPGGAASAQAARTQGGRDEPEAACCIGIVGFQGGRARGGGGGGQQRRQRLIWNEMARAPHL